jgi:predicted metal-dependent HD superfamily phosphohydrolase
MNSVLERSSEFVKRLFNEKIPEGCTYHNLDHTLEVVETASVISDHSGLDKKQKEKVLLACWFHDTGILESYSNHEEISTRICSNFLKAESYPQKDIDEIKSAILATKIPSNPKSIIEQVVCDADLAHTGKKGFNSKSDLLRKEWENILGRNFTDSEWNKNNIEFISSVKFYTKYAKENFEERRLKNLEKLKNKVNAHISDKDDDQKGEGTENDFKQKIKTDKQVVRGIETMFRNVMRTHVEFSGMADSKANIMISVNTLLLTAIIAILARKLDANPHLILPTALITLVSLTTLIYAVVVTRPKITSGIFTELDIKNKDTNLLFFGNFFRMDLRTFEWGMKEMMKDREYLYGSMIKDFYFLGQVLGKKYLYLRICYNIFMFGIILSVIAFAAAIILYPGPTHLEPLIE